MKYANFDSDGVFFNILIKDLHDIPDTALPITHEQEIALLNDRSGIWKLVNGEIAKTPLPEPEPYVPQSVTMRQARQALLLAGLLDDVDTAIASLPSPDKELAQIEWEYSQVVERRRQFVLQLGPALGLDDEALDALFVQAATL